MRLAINLGMFPPSNYPAAPEFTTRDMVETARLAEERGFEIACMPEAAIYREAIIPLACMATATRRIRLSTAVLPIYYRSPLIAGRTIAALDEVSGGRAILGLGVGMRRILEQQGFDTARPIARLREYVQVIKELLTKEKVTYRGEFYRMEEAALGFRPYRKEVPIFLGSTNRHSLELVGELADGVYLNSLCVNDQIGEALGYIRDGARRAGRSPAGIAIARFNITSVHQDPRRAMEFPRPLLVYYMASLHNEATMKKYGFLEAAGRIRSALEKGDHEGAARLVPDEAVDVFTVWGTPQQCRQRLESFERLGVQLHVLLPVGETPWDAVKGALSIAET